MIYTKAQVMRSGPDVAIVAGGKRTGSMLDVTGCAVGESKVRGKQCAVSWQETQSSILGSSREVNRVLAATRRVAGLTIDALLQMRGMGEANIGIVDRAWARRFFRPGKPRQS